MRGERKETFSHQSEIDLRPLGNWDKPFRCHFTVKHLGFSISAACYINYFVATFRKTTAVYVGGVIV